MMITSASAILSEIRCGGGPGKLKMAANSSVSSNMLSSTRVSGIRRLLLEAESVNVATDKAS